jgi:hypothetical protein
MRQNYFFRPAFLLVLLSLLFAVSVDAQKRSKKITSKAAPGVLWQRVNVGSQDLFHGRGGRSGMPDLSRVTFIREEKGGYSTKYRIRDGSNRIWVAKVGKEAQSETAAVRLLSALGYHTETVYLVPRITIPNKGTFSNVRLEARPDGIDRGKEWRWKDNPFVGTNQLQGLKIMMAMINNWDLKDSNNVILKSDGNRFYVISDLGATFGKMGISSFPLFRWIGRTRNEPKDYSNSGFVRGVDKGRVKLSYRGKNPGLLRNISIGQARWLADLLTQLSGQQIRDAFRAANYTPQEIDILARAFEDRILQLDRAASHRLASTR